MVRDTQDNEPFSFITLEVATKNVTRWLEPTEKQKEKPSSDTDPGNAREQNPKADSSYVDHRLREVAAWERKVNAGRKP